MKFSRLATEKDFQGYEVQYDHHREMGDDIKGLIEQDLFNEAVRLFAKQNGKGIGWGISYCAEYQNYVFAKRDFERGKMVFVNY